MGTSHFPLRRSLAALVLCAASSLPLAAAHAAAPTRDFSALTNAVANQKAQLETARNSAHPANGTGASEIFANTYRAYPPSCLNDGLPLGGYASPSAVNVIEQSITLLGDPQACFPGGDANECNFTETDTVTLWRINCSGGKSAALLEIDRPTNHSTTLYPTVPLVSATQGTKSLNIRFATDPNTFLATTYANQPLVNSDVFVLENFYGSTTQFDYTKAFSLVLDNFAGTSVTLSLPDYTAPTSPAPLEISGYMTNNWSSQTQGGEGMIIQVYDDGDNSTRTLAFAWFTYDKNGQPFWLFGQGQFAIGATQVSAATVYYQGGTFAPPTSTSGSASKSWGVVTLSFPDCGHMNVAYNSLSNPPSPVPSGKGSTVYVTFAAVNGLVCQ